MKKYRVLREFPFAKVGDLIEVKSINVNYPSSIHNISADRLIDEGWLAEVPEEKELWEKLGDAPDNRDDDYKKYWKEKAKIARTHFAEVARKAAYLWGAGSSGETLAKYIIQAIEKDGEA